MGKPITTCVIVGAAPSRLTDTILACIRNADYVIAADGGQRLLSEAGYSADLIVGDFDSSASPMTENCVILPTQKDDTDVMAAVRIALQKGATRFTLIGCIGGRLDHTIANVFVLQYLSEHGAYGELLDDAHRVMLLTSGQHTLSCDKSCYLSLFPYGGEVEGLTVTGAKYEATDMRLSMSFPIGVSNEAVQETVNITFRKGILLVILAKK